MPHHQKYEDTFEETNDSKIADLVEPSFHHVLISLNHLINYHTHHNLLILENHKFVLINLIEGILHQ